MPKPFFRILTKKVFIFINIILVALFLVGCNANLFYSKERWFVGLLTLASFYFLLILFLFFILWLFAKSKWALLFIATLLVSWKNILKIFPINYPSTFSMVKDSGSLRVMSWNVAQFDVVNYKKNHSVHDSMIALINNFQPDIACFQEMVAGDSVVDLNNAYFRKFQF